MVYFVLLSGFVCALKKPKPWGKHLKENTEYHFTVSNGQKLAINKYLFLINSDNKQTTANPYN